jgi:radical SAM protein with 4Fe4S-binding SPASM domain
MPNTRLIINTNGAAFNRNRHGALIDHDAIISLHTESLNADTYNKLMHPLRAERVHPKYEMILEAFPGKVQAIVPISNLNFSEYGAMRTWFLDRGAAGVTHAWLFSRCADDRTIFDSLTVKPAHPVRCNGGVVQNLIIDNDGAVLMCCNDFQRRERIGNVAEAGVIGALSDMRRTAAESRLDAGEHSSFATCSKCFVDLVDPPY